MTARTNHIRNVALALASDHNLTAHRLATLVHVEPNQAHRWIRRLRDEGLITPAGTESTRMRPGVGQPRKLWTLATQV